MNDTKKICEEFKSNLIESIKKYKIDYPDNQIDKIIRYGGGYKCVESEVDSMIHHVECTMQFYKNRY